MLMMHLQLNTYIDCIGHIIALGVEIHPAIDTFQ